MNEDDFKKGAAWACARMVEIFDHPTMAGEIFNEGGFDLVGIDEADAKYLRDAVAEDGRTRAFKATL